MKIRIRKFNGKTDNNLLESHPGSTVVRIGSDGLSASMVKDKFLELFTPDGIWFAFDDDTIIGVVLLDIDTSEDKSGIEVYDLLVEEAYRRKGIGGILLQKADMYARTMKINRILFRTCPDNVPARILMRKAGYRVTGENNGKVNNIKTIWQR